MCFFFLVGRRRLLGHEKLPHLNGRIDHFGLVSIIYDALRILGVSRLGLSRNKEDFYSCAKH